MKKEKLLLTLGLWVAVLSFLGFPRGLKSMLFVLTGLVIMYLAYIFYKQAKEHLPKNENTMSSFIDNINSEK